MNVTRLLAVVPVLLLSSPFDARAQQVEFDPARPEMSRADLESLLLRYDDVLTSTAYSADLRAHAAGEAARVRQRLLEGDFRTGDRIFLSVLGEPALPDTVPVGPGPSVSLPVFGEISLGGVLRSELEEHLTRELGRVIRNPVVEARALVRLSVQGGVARPGFYNVPADLLVDDALMLAGGPSGEAEIDGVSIERGNEIIHDSEQLREAMLEGRTLDQLNVRAGDRIIVPIRGEGGFQWSNLTAVTGILTLVTSLVVLIG